MPEVEPAPAPAPELAAVPEPAPVPAGGAAVTRRVYRLEPDPATDPDLADMGVWLRVRAVTLGQLLDYGFGPKLRTTPDAVFREFVAALVEWNLYDADTGVPVPPTWEGFVSLDEHLARRLIGMWQQLMSGSLPGPFGARSSGTPPATSGAPAPPMVIPMTPTAS